MSLSTKSSGCTSPALYSSRELRETALAGAWTRWSPEVFANPYDFVILNNIDTFKFPSTRMVLQQKKVLTQFELHQQIRLEFLKQKLLGLHHLESEMENQLKVNQDNMTHQPESVSDKASAVPVIGWQVVRVFSLSQLTSVQRFTVEAQDPVTQAGS